MAKKIVNITDVCSEIFAGGDAPKNKMSTQKTSEYTIPIYSNGEDADGLYGYTNFARVTLPSITVSARGTIGYTSIRNEPFVPIVRLITITPIPKLISIRYLYYAVKNLSFTGSGTSIPQLTVPMVKQYNFPLPPLDEQRKIAAVLDKVSDLIAKRRQQLNKLDELVKSRFIEMFGDPKDNSNGWPVLPLGKLFTVSSSKRIYQSEQTSSGIPFLRISDLVQRMDERTVTAELYISEQHYAALKKEGLVPVAGDILVTSRGTLGRCYEIKEDDRFYFQDGMISWLFDKKPMVTNTYIMQLFQMPGFRKQIDDIPAGSTVNYLSLARLKELRVMCPTIELQEQFIAFVEQVDKSKLAVQQGLQELEILKKSLMQEYFE